MTDHRCPLCDAVLVLPSGRTEASVVLAVLGDHFAQSCTAVKAPRNPGGHKDWDYDDDVVA